VTITIRLDTGNAAFEDKDAEVARIVRHVADLLAAGRIAAGVREAQRLHDFNGNTVGSVTLTGK
jgi:hypothetical protein